MATKTRKRVKQKAFDGMEEPTHRDIDDAADTYYESMLERQRLSAEEHEAKDNLLLKMTEHGLERYKMPDGKTVEVLSNKNVRIKKAKDAAEEPEEGAEE
jgi:hypothetical protein